MPNLSSLGCVKDTIPDGRLDGRTVWWRLENNAKPSLAELGNTAPVFFQWNTKGDMCVNFQLFR